jgi:hypothetical protein
LAHDPILISENDRVPTHVKKYQQPMFTFLFGDMDTDLLNVSEHGRQYATHLCCHIQPGSIFGLMQEKALNPASQI